MNRNACPSCGGIFDSGHFCVGRTQQHRSLPVSPFQPDIHPYNPLPVSNSLSYTQNGIEAKLDRIIQLLEELKK